MIDLKNLTIRKAHEGLAKKEFSARDLAEACLKNIDSKNKDINAYLEVYDDVMKQADEAQKMIDGGKGTLLTGIPLALKDNILIEGKKISAASKILEGYHATYDAAVIKELKKQGAVFIGRTNMDEFAMGSSTENSAFGLTKNPHDLARVAGGSSGGSAAALAMDGALYALGSDTGGSVRQPASFCGVVGLKPTYGAVSRSGLIAMGSSLDQIGPLTKTVEDAKTVFDAISVHDPMDSTSIPMELRPKPRKITKRIGVPRNFMNMGGIDESVLENFSVSLEKLNSLGYEIVDIELPNMKYSLPVYYILMPAEASTNLARFDGKRYGLRKPGSDLWDSYGRSRGEGFGKEVRRRIFLGTYVLSHGYYDAYYNKAISVRNLIEREFHQVFEKHNLDAIAMPTTPAPAFKAGEKLADPIAMYLSDIFTVPANIAGIPAISIPAGMSGGLPLDLQLLAMPFQEEILFKIGMEFEKLNS